MRCPQVRIPLTNYIIPANYISFGCSIPAPSIGGSCQKLACMETCFNIYIYLIQHPPLSTLIFLTSTFTILSALTRRVGIDVLVMNPLYHLHAYITISTEDIVNAVDSPQLILHLPIVEGFSHNLRSKFCEYLNITISF